MTRQWVGIDPTSVVPDSVLFAATNTRTSAGLVRAVVVGEIDAATIHRLDAVLDGQPRVGTTALVADLSRVSFCSISGGRSLVGLLDRTTQAGVPFALVVDTPAIRRMLQFVPGADRLSTHLNLASALAAVGSP